MDTLTHVLVGAALAEAGLRRRTPLALPTLVIAANLPDVDALSYLVGTDASIGFRRGLTHGALAFALLPLLLTAAMLLYDRFRRLRHAPGKDGPGKDGPGSPAARPGALLLLSYLGVLSHNFLDWLNTYGVRLLMPFDDRWLYGDTLFIIDVWLWLLLGGAVFLCNCRARRSLVRWGVLGLLLTIAFWLLSTAHPWARVPWLGGLALLVALRASRRVPTSARNRSRTVCLALLAACIYIVGLHVATVLARRDIKARLPADGIEDARQVFVGPIPIRPLAHTVVIETRAGYRFGSYDWLARPRWRLAAESLLKPPEEPLTRAALRAPCIQGMVGWVRFPWVEVEETGDGHAVYLMDARYTRSRTTGFGGARVRLSEDLCATCVAGYGRSGSPTAPP